MKKTTRYILAFLSLTLLCMALTACNPVPEMRAHHATWNEDGSISFNGKIYRQLPASDTFDPPGAAYEKTIWVTSPDVPVLLSTSFGSRFYISMNHNFLMNYSEIAYCEESIYDAVAASIEAGTPMLYYCIEAYTYDEETGKGHWERPLLDDATTAVLQHALAQEPINIPAGARLEYSDSVEVFRCSKDTYFRTFAFTFMYYNVENVGYIRVESPKDGTVTYYAVEQENLPLLLESLLYD